MFWHRLPPFDTYSDFDDTGIKLMFEFFGTNQRDSLKELIANLPHDALVQQWFSSKLRSFLFRRFCRRWRLSSLDNAIDYVSRTIESIRENWKADGIIDDGGKVKFAFYPNKCRLSDLILVVFVRPSADQGQIIYSAVLIRGAAEGRYLVLMDLVPSREWNPRP